MLYFGYNIFSLVPRNIECRELFAVSYCGSIECCAEKRKKLGLGMLQRAAKSGRLHQKLQVLFLELKKLYHKISYML